MICREIKMAVGFSGVRQYVGRLVLCIKLHRKSGLKFYWVGGGGIKNVAVTLKSIYEWSLRSIFSSFIASLEIWTISDNYR